jgi:hypothetical protein
MARLTVRSMPTSSRRSTVAIGLAFTGAAQVPGEGAQLYAIEAPAAVAQAQDCSIKGNVSRSGERIYHVPGGRFYERTKINEGAGERWFCSEEEAAAAGWRRSRQ